MTPSDIALNASDVARILRIGRNAVYALAKSGELKSIEWDASSSSPSTT